MAKATILSTITFEVADIENAEGVESKILTAGVGEQVHKMGTGETEVDCHIEVFLMKMLIGEHSRCYVERKSTKKILNFTIRIKAIEGCKHVHQLNPVEIVALAGQYKESGVRMFKQWPHNAHLYFGRAHKLLHSFPGCKRLNECTMEKEGIDGTAIDALMQNLRHNLAACLLLEERYEAVVKILDDNVVDTVSEKAMYRKAQALYHLKRYKEAEKCFTALPQWQDNPALAKLSDMIRKQAVKEKDAYAKMMKKMFQGGGEPAQAHD